MKISKKAIVFLIAIISLLPVLAYAGFLNTLEHNSDYDVSEYVYETLDKFTSAHKYVHDDSLDPGKGGNTSDAIQGVLDSDKVIDLYYGYDNQITVRYYDTYTENELTGTDYVSDKNDKLSVKQEHLTEYDVSDLADNIYAGYSFIDRIVFSADDAALKGTLTEDFEISVYLGRSHTITVNWIDEFSGEKIGDKTYVKKDVKVGEAYSVTDKKIGNIDCDGIKYVLDFVNVDDEENSGFAFAGNMPDKDITVDLYYTYNNKVTIRFRDKYTGSFAEDFTLEYEYRHNSNYDVAEKTEDEYVLGTVTRADGEFYDFIDSVSGAASGILDCDKEIIVVLGYYHKITVRYKDKYTGDVIHEEVISVGEAGSPYDLSTSNLNDINYNQMSYWYDGKEGDELSGVFDEDKNTTLYYGYDNTVLVSYKDMETKKEVHFPAIMSKEHLTQYGVEGMTDVSVDGYERLDYTTGDNVFGTLDTDKAITVWYSKMGRDVPSTGDENAEKIVPAVLAGLLAAAALSTIVLFEVIRKKKKRS